MSYLDAINQVALQTGILNDPQVVMVAVGFVVALITAATGVVATGSKAISTMQKNLDEARSREESARQKLSATQADKTVLEAEKQILSNELERAIAARDRAQANLDETNARLVKVIGMEAQGRIRHMNFKATAEARINSLVKRVRFLERIVSLLKERIAERDARIQELTNDEEDTGTHEQVNLLDSDRTIH
jgi:chromosome segregation ATPase